MLTYFNKDYEYGSILERVGSLSQVLGARKSILNNGRSKGVEVVDIRTGSGLSYTIIPDRGMDIAWAEFKGIPLNFLSGTGIASPMYYEPEGDEWLRGFYGGMLTTCGLTQVGVPCEYQGNMNGLHGRINNVPANNLCIEETWDGSAYKIQTKGSVCQVKSSAENLVLRRSISSFAGESRIIIEDCIENQGYKKQPFMLLYHCNIGFPLLNENAELIIPNSRITSMYEDRAFDIPNYGIIEPPKDEYEERVFYFNTIPGRDGNAHICILNDRTNPEIALSIQYNNNVLNNLAMWKQMSKGEYVVGIEPCNNHVMGVKYEAENNSLSYIDPQEKVHVTLEFEVINDAARIASLVNDLKSLSCDNPK